MKPTAMWSIMSDIGPLNLDDSTISAILDYVLELFDLASFVSDTPMKDSQSLSTLTMEYRLLFDEILKIDRLARTRKDIEKLVG
jgi:hypothetical protein